jgi:hypothetical protein
MSKFLHGPPKFSRGPAVSDRCTRLTRLEVGRTRPRVGKVKSSLCLIKHHAMKIGGIAPPFLTSALHGDELSVHSPAALPRGKSPTAGTHWIGG